MLRHCTRPLTAVSSHSSDRAAEAPDMLYDSVPTTVATTACLELAALDPPSTLCANN